MTYACCPSCRTIFRITEEQLDVRGGRVRCGQCAHVFNAREHVVASSDSAPTEPAQLPLDLGVIPAVVASKRRKAPISLEEVPEQPEEPAADSQEPPPADADERVEEGGWPGETHVPSVPAPAKRKRLLPWVAALAVLALGAALQAVWVFRGDLAMANPDLRPQLTAACRALGCDMPLPRMAGQIGLEASELRPASSGSPLLRLSATLRNRASFAQAYPDLELTLTDTDDKALARRVFVPKDYLGAKADEAAGLAANADLPVSLILDASTLTAAGYRLYVFYP